MRAEVLRTLLPPDFELFFQSLRFLGLFFDIDLEKAIFSLEAEVIATESIELSVLFLWDG